MSLSTIELEAIKPITTEAFNDSVATISALAARHPAEMRSTRGAAGYALATVESAYWHVNPPEGMLGPLSRSEAIFSLEIANLLALQGLLIQDSPSTIVNNMNERY